MTLHVPICDVVDITNNRVFEFEGSRMYLATGDLAVDAISNTVQVSWLNKPSRADLLVQSGDLIVARMKATNKVLLISVENEAIIVSTGFLTLRPRKGFDAKFLCYILKSEDFQRQKDALCTGSTQKAINNNFFEKILVPNLDLNSQKKIAWILEKAEATVAKREESLRFSDEFLKSTFLEMFGDPIKNTKKWKALRFDALGKLDRGQSKHRPRNAPELLGGPYPLIQTGEVANSNTYIKTYSQTYSELGLKQSKLWPKNTLCITIAANIAKTGILTFEACFPDSVVGFIPSDKTCVEYMHFWLTFMQKILEEKAPESAQKNINLGILRELPVPVPAIRLQLSFADIVHKVEALKEKQRQSQAELNSLFNSLMQKAFKGELV